MVTETYRPNIVALQDPQKLMTLLSKYACKIYYVKV